MSDSDSTSHDESSDEQVDFGAHQEPPIITAIEPAAEAPLTPPPAPERTAVLAKLSAPPFPRNGFPLLGILASVYEHVTAVAGRSSAPAVMARLDSTQPDRAA